MDSASAGSSRKILSTFSIPAAVGKICITVETGTLSKAEACVIRCAQKDYNDIGVEWWWPHTEMDAQDSERYVNCSNAMGSHVGSSKQTRAMMPLFRLFICVAGD